MKKLILLLIVVVSSLNSYGQFINYEPFVPATPGTSSGSSSNSVGEMVRATGFILDENGRVTQKISLKVSVKDNGFGENITIKAFYVNTGFGANWQNISVVAQPIGGNVALTKLETVAYANFNYWANWSSGKLWFSL
ncbi:MAG: hypothetical protein GZ094_03205 [Mariniphaga sp.]|nr:hypothetical protein [Mariniphaga sp.]